MLDSFFEIKSISNFLIEYESKNTQRAYGRLLKRYFNWLEINPDDYIKSKNDFNPFRNIIIGDKGYWTFRSSMVGGLPCFTVILYGADVILP